MKNRSTFVSYGLDRIKKTRPTILLLFRVYLLPGKIFTETYPLFINGHLALAPLSGLSGAMSQYIGRVKTYVS